MTPCIEWQHCTNKDGYGKVRFQGKNRAAHRVAFYLVNEYWPTICRHTCDNPPCINPEHLIDGTVADNNRDMVERGRHSMQKVTHCPQGHEYTPENIYRTRSGARVCASCSKDRQRQKNAKLREARLEREKLHPTGLTEAQVREIRLRYTGEYGQQAQLAREFKASPPTINKIVHGKRWSCVG